MTPAFLLKFMWHHWTEDCLINHFHLHNPAPFMSLVSKAQIYDCGIAVVWGRHGPTSEIHFSGFPQETTSSFKTYYWIFLLKGFTKVFHQLFSFSKRLRDVDFWVCISIHPWLARNPEWVNLAAMHWILTDLLGSAQCSIEYCGEKTRKLSMDMNLRP